MKHALTLTLLLAAVPAQEAAPAPFGSPAERLAAYAALPAEQRGTVVRAVLRRMQREPHEAVQRVVGKERGLASYGKPAARTWFDPATFAPVAPARTLVRTTDARHGAATAGMRPVLFLPELRRAVDFDWLSGKAVRVGNEPDDDAIFHNLAHGHLPATDHALAQILERLDDDPRQRLLADWFEHLYADRNGLVFENVSMFDAWLSGKKLEMPDVDVIAFARSIVKTGAFVSPIPDGRRRDRLYQQIQAAFTEHRAARSLRLALAAGFVAREPEIEAEWKPLLPRCHYLWARHGWDLAALAKALGPGVDRGQVLEEVDRALRQDPAATALLDGAREQLQAVRAWVFDLVDTELRRAAAR